MPLPIPNRESGVVRVTDNEGLEHEVGRSTQPVGPGERPWKENPPATDIYPGAGAEVWRMSVAGFWVVDVMREPTGGVSILREVESAESRRVEYDPPLPLLPASLTIDSPVEYVGQVRVYDHNSGALQSRGTCTATYRLLGSKQIALPGREVRAAMVQTVRRLDLPLVQVDIHILAAYVPGEGSVAWQTRRDIKLLGVVPVTREHRVVRVR